MGVIDADLLPTYPLTLQTHLSPHYVSGSTSGLGPLRAPPCLNALMWLGVWGRPPQTLGEAGVSGEGHLFMGQFDSGFPRQSLKQRWGVKRLSQGSEVVLVSPRLDQRCVQGTGSRPDGVWAAEMVSSPAKQD